MKAARLAELPTPALWLLYDKAFARVERAMTHDVPADSLRFGWDWPTAFALWPRLVASFEGIKGELRKRAREWCASTGLSRRDFVEQCAGAEWVDEE